MLHGGIQMDCFSIRPMLVDFTACRSPSALGLCVSSARRPRALTDKPCVIMSHARGSSRFRLEVNGFPSEAAAVRGPLRTTFLKAYIFLKCAGNPRACRQSPAVY